MSIIVTDKGFHTDTWTDGFQAWDDNALTRSDRPAGYAIDMPNTANPEDLVPFFNEAAMIRIEFPSFADGRGFTLARNLRLLGYTGKLRAYGHVISDQYTMARRCGFDEVEISADLAERQPETEWLYRADWQDNAYRNRLQQAG
ncbi:hypothetical protein GCM10007939_03910 [Amylibacter marinus]|uniref:DUF934 domain-containing protein n=1 Tax=Amylibacter marinus TaxID=1475483 RepID=A0ABQ5VSL4_9RHOB|nr:DUF934 domain-containing protein [Amylibacter marinus]GLQ34108.1 hypothetical protein GCM10007939_03910 [Amylibacter marinus]